MLARAAQYVRMSTDRQALSIDTQKQVISAYAAIHNIEVVRTYEDDGKSGVTIAGRKGIRQLFADVVATAERNFDLILIVDVSRFGRFQDIDEHGYYEFLCRQHGVQVVYVAEQFGSSTSPIDSLFKQLKRAMAGEYSRELGVKTRGGIVNVIRLGFAVGHMPFIGYRRQAVSPDGTPQRILMRGEQKPRLTDRVRLILGPLDEVEAVRESFRGFVDGQTYAQIVAHLQAQGIRAHDGTEVTAVKVATLLRCELVIGLYKWGLKSRSRSSTNIPRLKESLVNATMVPAIIDRNLWDRAQARHMTAERMHSFGKPSEELLDELRAVLALSPNLRTREFASHGLSGTTTYALHFGSVTRAYELAGREICAANASSMRSAASGLLRHRLLGDVQALLTDSGIPSEMSRKRCSVTINGTEVKVKLAPVHQTKLLQWYACEVVKIRAPDRWLLIMRVNTDRCTGIDFFLIPPEVHATFDGLFSPAALIDLEPHRLLTASALVERFRTFSDVAVLAG